MPARRGVGNLRDLKVKEAKPKRSVFMAYEPGYLHIDVKYLPQMADETSRRYLFVAINRATRWVCIGAYRNKKVVNARRFLLMPDASYVSLSALVRCAFAPF